MRENIVRHNLNLKIFTGFYHGMFFWRGLAKPKEDKPKFKIKTPVWKKLKTT